MSIAISDQPPTGRTAAARLRDDALPALPHLLSEHAEDLIEAVVPAAFDTDASVVEAAPTQVSWRPGRSLAVRYRVVLDGGVGQREESLVAYTGSDLPDGALRLTSEVGEAAAWRVSHDPWLPGLRAALDPAQVRALLQSIGVPPAPVHLVLRAYRAGRRAVVEVRTGDFRTFLKVVRPDRVERLQRRHRELEPLLPVPASHGWSEPAGLVVLQAMDGDSLRATLDRGESVPDPLVILDLLDRLPAIEDGPRSRSLLRSVLGHIGLVRELAPGATHAIDELEHAFREAGMAGPAGPLVPVHGDLHESQILVRDGALSALLDIDTVTLGERADDWALLVAHLDLHAADSGEDVAQRVRAYRDRVIEVALRDTTEEALRIRVAAAIFGQATSPFRVQTAYWPEETAARIERALAWISADGPLAPA